MFFNVVIKESKGDKQGALTSILPETMKRIFSQNHEEAEDAFLTSLLEDIKERNFAQKEGHSQKPGN
jgi:hypothetical protein